jgi:2-polyprenyl-3-methyl-5-hydroxy-6-metoxy-1,4-benzoquinol methylase
MIKDEFSAELLSELYSKYYPRATFKVEDYKPHKVVRGFRAWLDGVMSSAFRWVPENVRVLDIGCGFGESLGYFQSRGCVAYGIEADENIRRVAERFEYNVYVGLFNPDIYETDFFDYVTMAQVIEHVTDPVETLKGIGKVLKPGGNAILSTPNSNGWGVKVFGRRWINWHVPYHIQHFSFKSMKIAAERSGLILEQCETITPSDWLFLQWIHLVTYPNIGEPSGFWSPQVNLTLKQNIAVQLLSLIHRTKINHFITRLFDLFNMGDNHIFVLRKPK